MTTVTDLQETKKLNFVLGTYNVINCGVRTGKTYWAINNLSQFSRDGQANRVLYLVDTTFLKNSIINEYPDKCCDANDWWLGARSTWGENPTKIGIMCYQTLGRKAIKSELAFLENIDCICWDECDSIFNFAVEAYAKARKTDFARKDTTNEEILAVIQKYSSNPDYMPLVLLGEWEKIVNGGRIMCIGLSATPERVLNFYESLTTSANEGKLQMMYRQGEDIFFHNLQEYISKLTPMPGKGYWCYSPWIQENQKIVSLANRLGFHAIELHSEKNQNHPYTKEQEKVAKYINNTGMVPDEYDFVIVNEGLGRGHSIRDKRFTELIVNSTKPTEREQAARMTHNYSRALKTYADKIPKEFLNVWLTLEQCRELAKLMDIHDVDIKNKNNSKPMTWNRMKDVLYLFGYSYEKKRKRINGEPQQCYLITGTWKDADIPDKKFLALAAAKAKQMKDNEETNE